jgi:hypothetical protein
MITAHILAAGQTTGGVPNMSTTAIWVMIGVMMVFLVVLVLPPFLASRPVAPAHPGSGPAPGGIGLGGVQGETVPGSLVPPISESGADSRDH